MRAMGRTQGIIFAVGPDGISVWALGVSVVLALASLLLGVLFRAGRVRRLAYHYFDPDAPFYVRRLAFGLLPFGAMFIGFFSSLLLFKFRLDSAGSAVAAASLVSAAIGLYFIRDPPSWTKPRWLRDEERRRPHRGPAAQRSPRAQ